MNEIDNDASAYGMGNALSLPNFLADFLRGVGDRLQTKVENVRVDLELNLDLPMGSSTGSSVGDGSEIVTIRLLIKEVDLKGATTGHPGLDLFKSQPSARANINNDHVLPHIQYARPVILSHVQIMLLSDASVLASLSRFDAPSSPTAMQTSFAGPPGSETFENVSGPMSSSSSASLKTVESVIVQDNMQTTPTPTELDTSIIASDGERFADAENEGRSPGLQTSAYASSLEGSRYQDSILTDSFYLDDEANELDRLQQKSPVDSRLSQNNIDTIYDQQTHFSIQKSQHYNVPPYVTTFLEDTQDLAASSSSLMGNLGFRQEAIIDSQKATLLGHGLDKKEHNAQPLLERSSFVTGTSAGYNDDSAYPRLEDLAQSKIFSREEAESMYMSAISHASLPNKDQNSMIPGSWGPTTHDYEDPIQDVVLSAEEGKPISDHYSLSSRRSVSHLELGGGISPVQENERSSTRTKFLAHTVSPKSSASISAGETGSNRGSHTEGQADVSVQDSEKPSGRSDRSLLVSKKFISIDCITMMIPQDYPQASQDENQDELKHSEPEYTGWQPTFSSLPKGSDRCDAVSAPSDVNVPKTLRHEIADVPSQQQSLASKEPKYPHHRQISIHISNLELLGDFGLARLTILAVQQSVMLHEPKVSHKENREGYYPFLNDLRLQVANFSWKFLDSAKGFDTTSKNLDSPELETYSFPVAAEVLLKATVTEFDLLFRKNESSTYTKISLGKLCFGYASEDFLSFDPELKMRESTRDILAPINNDVILTISQTQESSKIHLTTLPLRFSLDLRRLDETFGWFGGFSSILGLGSSMISTVTVVNTKPRPPISHQGVHFEAQRPSTTSSDQKCLYSQKFTARIGSIAATLQGANCTLRLDSTAMKLVSRAEGIGLQVDRLKFAGPFLRHDAGAPSITASLANIRIEYLSTPKEVDLARLLALLSPSKDQYIHDDDILLDTLFRQRRQGGVIRITVESIQGYFSNLDHLQFLPDMAEELKKLSTVAKYLPEDDRPGILTLGLVHDLKCEITVDSKLGVFSTASEGLELAHVTLPSLTAIAMRRFVVSRNNIEELLGEAAPNNLRPARPPMIMARFVGDEMEPTVKIKLQNLRVEYHVSTLMALLELIHETDMEGVVSEMVSSIANLTSRQQFEISPPGLMSQTSAIADKNFENTKPTRLDIAIRDSMIGLNPRNSPAKGLVVLTNAQLQGSIPINGEASAVLEIKKASLMVIDDLDNIAVNDESTGEDMKGAQKDQIQDLLESGFVSVSYISSASASLNLTKTRSDEGTSLDVEIRDDLFVLESCADSTQTLQTIINGLKPPMPPSIDLKYRTEIVPVEDMLTSFSGDAYAMPQRSEGGNLESSSREVDEGDMADDEAPQNLEFVSSFYNPDPEGFREGIADSILDDDLESLAGPPVTRKIGDRVLLESFQEQYQVTPGGAPLDFQEHHFATNSRVGGTAHRWDAKQNSYGLANDSKIRASPLRLRIRDVHIIWNLFDGYDWQHTRDVIGKAILEVESKASERFSQQSRRKSLDSEEEEESEIGDFLFNSIYIGVPANRDPKDLARQVNRKLDDLASETESYATSSASGSPSRQSQVPRMKGKKQRLTRSKYHKMTFELKGVSVDFVVFPPHTQEPQSSVDIRVQDLDIFDHVPSSTWKKFATYMHDAGERESGTSMIHIEILNVKPVPTLAASEIILKVMLKSWQCNSS